MPEEYWAAIQEANILTGIPVSTIARWARDGRITARHSGRLWIVEVNSIKDSKLFKRHGGQVTRQEFEELKQRFENHILANEHLGALRHG